MVFCYYVSFSGISSMDLYKITPTQQMKLRDCFAFLVIVGLFGLICFSVFAKVEPQSLPKSYTSNIHTRESSASSARKTITTVSKPLTEEQALFIEKERVRKTELIRESLGSRNATELVLPSVNTVILQPHKKLTNGRKPFAVILVTSLADDVERRVAIRKTWYSWADKYNCLVYFFLGLPTNETMEVVEEEAELYGDIICDDFEEAYYKLTIKTLRMLKWFLSEYNENPPNFYIKTDQDVFLNLPMIVPYLKKMERKYDNFIGGMRHHNISAHRSPLSKWFVPTEVYEPELFPEYAAGPFYAITGDLVKELYTESFQVPLIHLEDVYLLGLVANQRLHLRISDVKNIKETFEEVKSVMKSRGVFRRTLVFHPMESSQMETLFKKFEKNPKSVFKASSSAHRVRNTLFYVFVISAAVTKSLLTSIQSGP